MREIVYSLTLVRDAHDCSRRNHGADELAAMSLSSLGMDEGA
jgi:hypothetical protein